MVPCVQRAGNAPELPKMSPVGKAFYETPALDVVCVYALFLSFALRFFRDRRELLWITAISYRVWCVPSLCDFRRRLREHPQRATNPFGRPLRVFIFKFINQLGVKPKGAPILC